jgi:hypothetical protein
MFDPDLMRPRHGLGILVAGVLALACSSGLQAQTATQASPLAWRIHRDGIGPVRIGMSVQEARRLLARYPVVVADRRRSLEGESYPVIAVAFRSTRMFLIEPAEGKVWRIETSDPRLSTPEGVKVGSRLTALERHYGRGKILTGEGNVCAAFQRRAPGRSFCLAAADRLAKYGDDWNRIRRMNPRVAQILVTGPA